MEQRPPHIEQLLKEGRVLDKIDRERAELFESLVVSKGWIAYTELLTTMIEERGQEILQPAGSVDGAVALEHVKGTMYGLLLARNLPSVTIAQMNASRPTSENDEDADNE